MLRPLSRRSPRPGPGSTPPGSAGLLSLLLLAGLVGCGDGSGGSGPGSTPPSGGARPVTTIGLDAPLDTDHPIPVSSGILSGVETYSVGLQASEGIPLNEVFPFEVVVRPGPFGGPLPEDLTVAVDARMPAHQHGMKQVPSVHPLGDGRFRVEGMLLHMTGVWELYVDVTDGAVTERAQYTLTLE